WSKIVLRELHSDDPAMRYEAARTAGELELREAVPTLGKMLDEDDREVKEMAIWALGEIGGDRSRKLLENLMETADSEGDDSLTEAIEEALQSANLVGEGLIEE